MPSPLNQLVRKFKFVKFIHWPEFVPRPLVRKSQSIPLSHRRLRYCQVNLNTLSRYLYVKPLQDLGSVSLSNLDIYVPVENNENPDTTPALSTVTFELAQVSGLLIFLSYSKCGAQILFSK